MSNLAADRNALQGRLLIFARAAWLLVSSLAIGICILALLLLYADHRTFAVALNTPELETPAFARYYIGINAVFAAFCTLIAAIVFWRRADEANSCWYNC